MSKIPITIKPVHSGQRLDNVFALIKAAYTALAEDDRDSIDRQVLILSKLIPGMGEKGAMELCYALGRYMNGGEKDGVE